MAQSHCFGRVLACAGNDMTPVKTNPMPSSSARALASPKSVRMAHLMNLILPGAGQFHLGQRVVGCVFGVLFLSCFVTMTTIFGIGYARYWQAAMSGKILEGHELETLALHLHAGWLLRLLAVSLLIYLGSAISLFLHVRNVRR